MSNEITVQEKWEAMELSLNNGSFDDLQSTASKIFIVRGTDDDVIACETAYASAPPFVGDKIPKKQVSLAERCGADSWKVIVQYAYTTGGASLGGTNLEDVTEVVFDCSSATMHITQALSQECRYSSDGQTANSYLDADHIPIGWNGKLGAQSEITGVDVECCQLRERYTAILPRNTVLSANWKKRVASCMNKMNSKKFKGWDEGEMLFVGCSYSTPAKGVNNVRVTFEFLVRRNEKNVNIGEHNIGDVLGHDYIWATTEDTATANSIKKRIKQVFVAKVFKSCDFDVLGI